MTTDASPSRHLTAGTVLAVSLSLFLIAAATLVPSFGAPHPNVGAACALCGDIGATDLVLNILLFVPLGVALGRAGLRPSHVLGIAVVLSGAIELAQMVLPGRSSTWRDVLTNAVGSGLGALLARHLASVLLNRRLSTVLLAGVALIPIGAAWLTGILVAPDPPVGTYYVHWSPRLRHLEPWTGTVRDARIGGSVVPEPRVDDSSALRALIAAGAAITITGEGGKRTTRLGGILTLSDADDREVLLVGVQGEDLVVRTRRRAARLRLDAPDSRFRGALPVALEGRPLSILIDGDPVAPCATVNGRRSCIARPSAGRAWAMLRWIESSGTFAQALLDALTFAAFAAPVGLLVPSAPRRAGRTAIMVMAAGLVAISALTGLALPGVTAAIAVLGGLVAGGAANVYCVAHWSTPPRQSPDPGSP